jgi:predicted nucleic acid-binding protein
MTYLLDVNVLMAALWTTHAQHAVTDAWLKGKQVALCPISEMGFLRVSTHPRALGAVMAEAERFLAEFYKGVSPRFVPADLSACGLGAKNSDAVTDHYLARLADRHKMKLGTLDGDITHPAVELIA